MKAESIAYVLDCLGGDGGYKRSGDHLMSNCVNARWGHNSGVDDNKKLGILVQQGMAPCNCFYPGCLPDDAHTLLGLVGLVGGKRVAAGEMTPDELSALKAFVIMAEEDDDVLADPKWGAARPKEQIPQDLIAALNGVSPYWKSRGISDHAAQEWKLGEAGGRALIPFYDRAGDLVAVQGRLIPGLKQDAYPWDVKAHDEKYRSFPVGFAREELLVGEHLITKPVDFLIVVESPIDAVMLTDWLRNSPDEHEILPYGPATNGWAVVATMGGEIATQQAQKMVELLSAQGELAVGLDMDHAGQLATRKLIGYDKSFPGHRLYRRLSRISEITWARKDPSDTDGGTIPLDEVKALALKAIRTREDWLSKRLAKRT